MLKFIYSFLGLVFLCHWAFGQSDTAIVEKKIEPKPVISTKIRVGLDLSRLFLTATRKEFSGTEGSFDVNFGQWIYEAHLGYAAHSQRLKTYTPVSEGVYGSVGIAKNIFGDNHNILAFGVRVAGSSYGFQPTNVKIAEPLTNQQIAVDLGKGNCSAVWSEVVGAIRAQVFGWVLMGFEVRLKPMLYSHSSGFRPYSIPGYGLYNSKTSVGFNYFIYINLPTGKSK